MPPKTKKADTAAAATVAKQAEKLKKVAAEEAAAAEVAKPTTKKSKAKTTEEKVTSTPVDEPSTAKVDKPKRPPTEYQIFKKTKLEELRTEYDDEETRPGYKDLLKMVNEAWHEKHPKKATPAKKEPGQKRAPSAYNIFVKETMPIVKKEHEGSDKKQTDYMSIIAKMWTEKKLAANIK
jgi:hypothetical protein